MIKAAGADRVAGLAERFLAVFPSLDPHQQRLALQLYRLLAQGHPVIPARLAETAKLSLAQVEKVLSSWSGVYYENGAVIGFWGLSPRPVSRHVMQMDGRKLYAWCAWDSLFLPEILGGPIQVSSVDPELSEAVALTVTPKGIEYCAPSEIVMSILDPSPDMTADIVTRFCHFIHFFTSPESAARWTSRHSGASVLSLDEAFRLGALKNQRQLGEALHPRSAAAKGKAS